MAKTVSQELIFQIYNAATRPETWQKVLELVANELKASHAFLASRESHTHQPFAFIDSGFEDGHFAKYQDYFYQVDIWTQSLAAASPNQFHASHEVCCDKKFINSEIYHDFAKPANIRHSIGSLVQLPNEHTASAITEVAFMRGKRGKHFSDNDVALANTYLSHVQQSLQISLALQTARIEAQQINKLIDYQDDAMCIVSNDLKLLYKNKAMESIMRSFFFCKESHSGTLTFIQPEHQQHVTKAVKELSRLCFSQANNGIHTVKKRVTIDGAESTFEITLTPWLYQVPSPLQAAAMQATLLTIRTLRSRTAPPPAKIKDSTGLTISESHIASLLCEGLDLSAIANQRRTHISTVRQQIKSIMQKLQCNSRSQMVSKLLTSLN